MWQALREELHPQGLELVTVGLDTLGADGCRAFIEAAAPTHPALIDQLADEYVGKVKVTHLDIDESPGTASKYGIRGVPTLMVFKGGELVAQHIGAAPKTTIAQLMDRAL